MGIGKVWNLLKIYTKKSHAGFRVIELSKYEDLEIDSLDTLGINNIYYTYVLGLGNNYIKSKYLVNFISLNEGILELDIEFGFYLSCIIQGFKEVKCGGEISYIDCHFDGLDENRHLKPRGTLDLTSFLRGYKVENIL